MGYSLLQGQAARPLLFQMIDSGDHVTPKTGLSPTVTLSKNGAAFASPSGAVTEIASGWYKVAGNATDSGTLGPLVLHATGTGADPCDDVFEVVAYDPDDAVRLGQSSLPNAAAGANGGLPVLSSSATTLAYTVSTVTTLTNPGGDTSGTTTLLSRLSSARAGYLDNLSAGAAALASQIPADFTSALFASAGVFSAGALANAPAGGGGGLDAAGVRAAIGLAAANLDTQIAAVKSDTAAILLDTGTDGVVVASASKTGYSLAAAGLDAVVVEVGLNARQALSVTASALAGVLAGAATTTVTIAAAGVPATNRITSTVDSDGNRTAVTINAPA